MARRFGGCSYQAALRVTARTGRTGRSESAAHVAAFTGHVNMCTIEFESGAEVIEFRLGNRIVHTEQTG